MADPSQADPVPAALSYVAVKCGEIGAYAAALVAEIEGYERDARAKLKYISGLTIALVGVMQWLALRDPASRAAMWQVMQGEMGKGGMLFWMILSLIFAMLLMLLVFLLSACGFIRSHVLERPPRRRGGRLRPFAGLDNPRLQSRTADDWMSCLEGAVAQKAAMMQVIDSTVYFLLTIGGFLFLTSLFNLWKLAG
ncbi:MAG: hypothetical protein ACK5IB_10030 [Qingshengfaniella sp.]